jgi:hypothetical protein
MSGMPGPTRTQHVAGSAPIAPSDWAHLSVGNTAWTMRASLVSTLHDGVGLRWSEWRARRQLHSVKHGPHRSVYRLSLAGGEFYLKHYRVPDWKALARNIFAGNPAVREWQAALRLAELGLSTFEPIALGLVHKGGIAWDGFLVSRAIPEALPLDHFLLTEFAALPAPRQAELRQEI